MDTLLGQVQHCCVAKLLTDSNTAFPDENVSPKKKAGKEHLLKFARAAVHTSTGMAPGMLGYASRDLYKTWWDYAHDRQEIDIYSKLSGIQNDDLINLNSIWPVAGHFFNQVVGIIEKAGWKIRIGTIDPQATNELAEKQAERKARLLMRQAATQNGMPELAQNPQIAAQPGEPDDVEGLEIMAMGEQLPICADAQDIIRAVFNNNKFDRIRREAIQWLFVTGAAIAKDDTETDGITVRMCELGDIIMPYCKYADFRDLTYVGEVRTIPVSALVEMAGDQLTREELEQLYEVGNTNQWYSADNYGTVKDWWGNAKVQVLDLEIISTDIEEKEESKNKFGNLEYGNATENEDKKEYKKSKGNKFIPIEIQNVYRCKWVLGTDILFDYGKQINIKRDNRNPACAHLSYHVIAPNIREMIPYSRMAAIRPMVDDMITMNYKRRWTLNRAVPSGYAFDLDGLEDIDLNGGGKAMTKQDVLDFWIRTGNLLHRKRAVNGSMKGDTSLPIQFIKGGIGDEVVEYQNQIIFGRESIKQTLGLNDVTDASTVNAKNLNSTNQAMMVGTNNALSDLFFADKQLAQDISGSVLLRAQDLMRPDTEGKNRADDLANIVGRDTVKRIGAARTLDAYHFGITIEDEPTTAQEEDFNASLNLALKEGQISVDERFMAKTIAENNILQAQLYLSYRVKKNKEAASQEAARREQSNAQLSQQSAMVAEQARQQTIQVQLQADLQKMQIEHQYKMEEIGGQGAITLEKERIAATGRVESSFTQAVERDTSNMRDNTSKLIKEGHEKKIDLVNIPADLKSRVEPVTSDTQPALPQSAFSFLNDAAPPQPPQQMPQQQPEPQEQAGEPMPEGAQQPEPAMMG